MNPLVTICAWCPTSTALTKAAIKAGHEVTHTICAACVAKMEAQT